MGEVKERGYRCRKHPVRGLCLSLSASSDWTAEQQQENNVDSLFG